MTFHTEHEAQQKWCPLTERAMRENDRCIGANCMAWDWEDGETEYRSVDHYAEDYSKPAIDAFKPPEGEGWKVHGEPFRPGHVGQQWRLGFKRPFGERRRGFCGLARRAEVQVVAP